MRKHYSHIAIAIVGSLAFATACQSNDFSVENYEKARVVFQAEKFLDEKPVTVTYSYCERSEGNIHDYYSEGDYWWPNPDDPDGPYIRKDGLSNPDNFNDHRKALRRFSIIVPALVSAYKLTGEEKYADAAWKHVLAWFVNEKTKMNPNMNYSQAIKGRVTGRGIGIIDAIHFVEIVQAIMVLERENYGGMKRLEEVKNWFKEFLNWLTTSDFGIKERDNGNNHSTCWAMQAAEYAKFTGNKDVINYCKDFYKNIIIPNQIAKDGSFPKELKRTKPYGYSLFNLEAMSTLVEILSDEKENLWFYKSADGRGIQLAMDFMFPFIKDKNKWHFPKDVMYWDDWPVRQISLFFAWKETGDAKYLDVWKQLNPEPEKDEIIRNYPIRQPVLWIED